MPTKSDGQNPEAELLNPAMRGPISFQECQSSKATCLGEIDFAVVKHIRSLVTGFASHRLDEGMYE